MISCRTWAVFSNASSSSARHASFLGRSTRFWAMSGRLRSSSVIVWNRPSQCDSTSEKLSCSTPVTFSPIRSRRSRWRATKLMIGTGRSDLRDSTSLASLFPSVWTKPRSAECVASQRISSSRNRIRPS